MALWKLVLHSYDTQVGIQNDMVNVFGYDSNLPVIGEESALADAFLEQVLPDIVAVVHASTVFYRLEVVDVEDGVLYLDRPITADNVGARSGDKMPQFVAWGFKYQRATIGARSGAKRFGTVAEPDVADGFATGAIVPLLDALADQLGAPLTIGITQTWFPVILERKPVGVYPWGQHPISGVSYRAVTTQNSRKR